MITTITIALVLVISIGIINGSNLIDEDFDKNNRDSENR
jgi:hypothetical protein